MNNTCFVVMPIGTQNVGELSVSAEELRKKYDYIIKDAIMKADQTLNVIRADDEPNPGSMSNDIFMKLMYSKYVIADVTYPNPNVFYELGIRHAISRRTILIKEQGKEYIPFDIAHLRYIEYTHDIDGMSRLSERLKQRFSFYRENPEKPDNQFLELCEYKKFVPDVFECNTEELADAACRWFELVLGNQDFLNAVKNNSEAEQEQAILKGLGNSPDMQKAFAKLMLFNGASDT